MSITMWKAIHDCLPVDDRICRIGISIVSRCDCCSSPKYEDFNHCLARGEFAEKIWRLCSVVLGVPWREGGSWRQRVECWYRRAKNSNRPGQLLGLLPAIITWRFWGRRCKARMEGLMDSVQQVWCSIKYWVSWIALKLKDVNLLTRRDEGILQYFNMPLNVMSKEFIFPVKWKPPKQGWVKLNIDGCSLGNPGPSGAGGIIRDDKGDLLCGFAEATGHNSNNYAELMGLLHGLRHIGLLGISSVEIELDSMLVLNWLRNQRCGLWYMEDYWDEIQSRIAGLNVSLVHCYRECNSVSDGFAKMEAKGQSGSWFSLSALPAPIRGNIRLDRGGLPYIRKARRRC
ncbi:hypothetical protein F2P56_030761 [Juglans regia]|uniref:Uncharacterized protein LOC108994001 n=2 Tax=Juglans regia TaxID=51240 RepID=A0A2I4EZ07_JUGRE|nr:uncharacterized protein LOC108994001 [Juglans regia]KAF5450403.1 hypothetical protein F2P56_030761 [Juglans regia]